MTGEEARERVIEAISRAFGPQTRADSALATLGLDWTQAAALMSGEAEVAEKRKPTPCDCNYQHAGRVACINAVPCPKYPMLAASPASEKETPL